jgi:predicted nucleotidyltransferase
MIDTGLDERTKRIIVGVISALLPEAKIYLFGSRAKGTHRKNSDIDLAVDAGKELPRVDIGEARDMLNESNIPFKFDVVDLQAVNKEMQDAIRKDGIVWKS